MVITTAPCCWGVDDINNPGLPPWQLVFDEAAEAGYGGPELGPYGYVPLDHRQVSDALNRRGLFIVAGTIFADPVPPANRDRFLRQTDGICALVTRLPRPRRFPGQRHATPSLTVIDWGHDERDYAAGHPDRAWRMGNGTAWSQTSVPLRTAPAHDQPPGHPCPPAAHRLRGLHHGRAGARPANADGSFADKASRDYLKRVGL